MIKCPLNISWYTTPRHNSLSYHVIFVIVWIIFILPSLPCPLFSRALVMLRQLTDSIQTLQASPIDIAIIMS